MKIKCLASDTMEHIMPWEAWKSKNRIINECWIIIDGMEPCLIAMFLDVNEKSSCGRTVMTMAVWESERQLFELLAWEADL